MFLKLSFEGRVIKQNFSDDATLHDLFIIVEKSFSVKRYHTKLLHGYPPTSLATENAPPTITLKSLGISNSDSLIIRKDTKDNHAVLQAMGYTVETSVQALAIAPEAEIDFLVEICGQIQGHIQSEVTVTSPSPPAPAPSSGPSSGYHQIERHVINADNSCLFNAIGYLVDKIDPMHYRHIIAQTIRETPSLYTADMLGKEPDEYIGWILNSEKWGGKIESHLYTYTPIHLSHITYHLSPITHHITHHLSPITHHTTHHTTKRHSHSNRDPHHSVLDLAGLLCPLALLCRSNTSH